MASKRNPYSMTGLNAGGILSGLSSYGKYTPRSNLYGITIDADTPTDMHGNTNAYLRWMAALSMIPRAM